MSRRRLVISAAALALASRCTPDSAGAERDAATTVDRLLRGLSLTEKVAQLFVVQAVGTSMTGWYEDQLRQVKPGGVLFVAPNIGTPEQLRTFVKAIHRTNEDLPPLVAVDQEGGPVTRIPGDPAPGAVELGQASDRTVRRQARKRAAFLREFGFDVNLAPVADVAYGATSAMARRSFGTEPEVVADKVHDFVRGSRAGGVLGAAKHFPGHGRTAVDSHVAMPEIRLSRREWLKSDGLPFQAAVDAGVELVMLGHLRFRDWDGAPASLSPVAVDVLRGELGFDGVIITDDLGMGALAGLDPREIVDRALKAGVDLLLYASPPVPIPDLVAHVCRRVKRGELSERRLDASLRRILALKVRHFNLDLGEQRRAVRGRSADD